MNKTIRKAMVLGSTFATAMQGTAVLMAVHAQSVAPIRPGTGFADKIGTLINFVLQVVMVIALLLVFGYLIIGSIEWITSGGDKSKTESARNKITAAVVGLIILAASYAIFLLLLRFLGFTSLERAIEDVPNIKGAGGNG